MTSLLSRSHARIVSTTVVVLTTTLLLPFLFHLLPAGDGPPLGARLLPIFYAPFLAAVLFHPAVALTSALLAPSLNHALTARPAPEMVAVLTLELLLFVGLVLLVGRRWPLGPLVAPVAYVMSHLVVASMLGSSWQTAVSSIQVALPGVVILFVIGLLTTLVHKNAAK